MSIGGILRRLGVTPKKGLGQHFLVDRTIAAKIAGLVPRDSRVLEVGGGLGTLTASLLEKTSKLTVVEIDGKLARYLKSKFDQIEVLHADFLKLKIPQTEYIVSSVPYSISRDFVLKLVREGDSWRNALLILQKEFVEKLLAKPCEENYRAISVVVQAACRIEQLESIPRECFYPIPRVDSLLIRMSVREAYNREEISLVESLAFRLFSFKNKTVKAALKTIGVPVPQSLKGDPLLDLRVGCVGVEGVVKLAKAL